MTHPTPPAAASDTQIVADAIAALDKHGRRDLSTKLMSVHERLSARPAESVAQGGEVEPVLSLPSSASAWRLTWVNEGGANKSFTTDNLAVVKLLHDYWTTTGKAQKATITELCPTPATGSGGEAAPFVIDKLMLRRATQAYLENVADHQKGMEVDYYAMGRAIQAAMQAHPAPAGGEAGGG